MTTNPAHPERPIDTRLKIAALWTSTMLIFAYVDLFSLYRPDVRADIAAGKVFAFDIGQPFLFFATLYVVVPAVMIYLSLVLPRRANRNANLVLAGLYAVTIVGGAIGEWSYYVFGSATEAFLMVMVLRHAWTWPELASENDGRAAERGPRVGAYGVPPAPYDLRRYRSTEK